MFRIVGHNGAGIIQGGRESRNSLLGLNDIQNAGLARPDKHLPGLERHDESRDSGQANARQRVGRNRGDKWAGVGQAVHQAGHRCVSTQFPQPLRSTSPQISVSQGADEQFLGGRGADGRQGAGSPPAPVGISVRQQITQQGQRGSLCASVAASIDGVEERPECLRY